MKQVGLPACHASQFTPPVLHLQYMSLHQSHTFLPLHSVCKATFLKQVALQTHPSASAASSEHFPQLFLSVDISTTSSHVSVSFTLYTTCCDSTHNSRSGLSTSYPMRSYKLVSHSNLICKSLPIFSCIVSCLL